MKIYLVSVVDFCALALQSGATIDGVSRDYAVSGFLTVDDISPMSQRAECVMLNKGPYITDALRILDHILKRMDPHQSKKSAKLRALKLALDFDGETSSTVRNPRDRIMVAHAINGHA